MRFLVLWFFNSFLVTGLCATEYNVSIKGSDQNPGTRGAPFRTIQHAAQLAQPGDIITVHQGVYRERINPPRGGESDAKRIVYQAAPSEKVEIKGSEQVKGWVKVHDDVWKLTLTNSFFGNFNPYADLIHGDWFDPRGREHHTGAVYLNGEWLTEAARLEDFMKEPGKTPLWFGRVSTNTTTIWAQFPGVDPNAHLVEINVRQTVFYPSETGRNYITVRGFIMSQAATPWAPPTAEQIGLIGPHWSKAWLIENNLISHSVCCGISLGKYGDQWDNTSANTAEGYVKTIERGLENGWNKENVGHHVVRNNTISHCEQAGIVGSLGAAFSTVSGNTIYDIHVRRLFSGAEMAGIKFHGAIDTVIRSNHIYQTCRGLWLDWMAQGTRVSGNLFHNNDEDVFVEVDHGPFLMDNNLFLSKTSLADMSEGGAYVCNLFCGKIVTHPEPNRSTPYHPAHLTTVAGLVDVKGGDDRFFNNIFIGNGVDPRTKSPASKSDWDSGYGLWVYNEREFPIFIRGNIFYAGARPYTNETHVLQVASDPLPLIKEENNKFFLCLNAGNELKDATAEPIDASLLGKARVAGLAYENPDGSPVQVTTDYFGRKRTKWTPGPFEKVGKGDLKLRVW